MEVPAERHSTMAAPDADQDEPPNRPVDTARYDDRKPTTTSGTTGDFKC